MRISSSGIERASERIEFTFEGNPIAAYPGESLAAALIAAGISTFRKTRAAASRGPFCGMGVCGECRVLVNGSPVRACMEPARANAEVRIAPALAPAEGHASGAPPPNNWREIKTDVLIIGGGPAGLAAARVAAAAGLDVLVVDERRKPGGQYFKQPAEGFRVDEAAVDAQFAEGMRLLRAARESGAKIVSDATVWGAFATDVIAAVIDGRTQLIRAQRLILATGAYERAVPVPGWTTPGVMTTGAAQTLLRAYQVAPGRRILIAGNGPLNLQVAYELARAGAEVVALVESAAAPFMSAPAAVLSMASTAPRLLATGLRQTLELRLRGVRTLYRHALVSVEGDDRVTRASVAKIGTNGRVVDGTRRSFDVDAVCVNYGFLPQNELARALGCAFDFEPLTASFVARRGADGRSSLPNVFIVGDAGGMRGARVALAQGALAGAAVAADLGRGPVDVAAWKRELHKHHRFQDALWQLFAGPALITQLADPGTVICRCEEVDRRTIEDRLDRRAGTFGAIKRTTRLGMGQCQGRYCATLCADMLRERIGQAPSADDFFAPRAPAKPVAIAQLAGDAGAEPAAVDILRTVGRDANICLDPPARPTAP
jgi:NADPH-dependent 2,4-dienoyl-CoA reductase/sulfur reductase-like enzyme